ncbi:MAG: hypothetical protein ACK5IJ_04310 [Mangrovibacterium sp.]
MKQRNIWMLYLSIGVISCILSGCKKQVEYIINADIIYKNETPHTLKYFQYSSIDNYSFLVFELLPNAEKVFEIRGDGGHENPSGVNDYIGIFEGLQGNDGVLIQYDGNKCLVYKAGEGSTTENFQQSYESQKINDRYYAFTYTFSNEEYQSAVDCASP